MTKAVGTGAHDGEQIAGAELGHPILREKVGALAHRTDDIHLCHGRPG